jgi:hypothetical protein
MKISSCFSRVVLVAAVGSAAFALAACDRKAPAASDAAAPTSPAANTSPVAVQGEGDDAANSSAAAPGVPGPAMGQRMREAHGPAHAPTSASIPPQEEGEAHR